MAAVEFSISLTGGMLKCSMLLSISSWHTCHPVQSGTNDWHRNIPPSVILIVFIPLIRRWITFIRLSSVKQVEDKQDTFFLTYWQLTDLICYFNINCLDVIVVSGIPASGNLQTVRNRDMEIELCYDLVKSTHYYLNLPSYMILAIWLSTLSFLYKYKLLESDDLQSTLVKF